MKLRSIVENGYEGLEDADRFGDPEELRALLKVHKFMALYKPRSEKGFAHPHSSFTHTLLPIIRKIFDRQTIQRMKHELDWNPYDIKISHEELDMVHQLIQQHPELQVWWNEVADAPERLEPSYGRDPKHLVHLGFNESYEGLEDADQFGGDIEFMGEGHLGPHIFRVYYHKPQDLISMEVNGYEISPWEDHMPSAQKETIMRDLIKHRPDLVQYVRDHSVNGRMIEIGLALVDVP
jgi:hypothetical protein